MPNNSKTGKKWVGEPDYYSKGFHINIYLRAGFACWTTTQSFNLCYLYTAIHPIRSEKNDHQSSSIQLYYQSEQHSTHMFDSNNFSDKKVFSRDQMQLRPTLLPDSGNSPVIPPHKFECRIHFLPHLWQERRAGYIYPGKKSRLFTRAKVAHVIYFARHWTQKLM